MPNEVQIDTDGVGEVARGMRSEADGGFAAAARRGESLHRHGVQFGARLTVSSVVTDAKQRYARALEHTEANLRAYQVAAGVLADAAEQIARMFASSDMTSAQAQRQLQDLIDGAVRVANRTADGTAEGMLP